MKLTRDERIVLSDIAREDERSVFDIEETNRLASRGLVKIHECADGDFVTITPSGRATLKGQQHDN